MLRPLLVSAATALVACMPAKEAREKRASLLEHETVALVQRLEDGSLGAYCSGVWVSETKILTAEHCIDDTGEPNAHKAAVALHDMVPEIVAAPPPWDPTGQPVAFEVIDDLTDAGLSNVASVAVILSADKSLDLALLEATPVVRPHPFAELGAAPRAGDHLVVVGHPGGLVWSYAEGVVASGARFGTTPDDPNGQLHPYTQLSAPGFWFGNSGGGAFDEDGRLVGIASFFSKGPQISFFVHRDTIAGFLRDLRVIRKVH